MNYSITGIAYLTLFFPLAYLIYRLLQYWNKEKDTTSKHGLFIVGLFGLFVLMTTIGGLFFADNSFILEKKIEVGSFIQALTFAVIAYHVIYLKFPRISPWLGFVPVFILGMIAAILTVTHLQFNPFLEPSGAINWGFPSGSISVLVSLIRFFLSLITLLSLIIIFILKFKDSKDPYLRGKALGLSLAFFFVLIGASLDFLFIAYFNLNAITRDIAFIFCSIILFVTLIFTLPRSPSTI